ncbi:MAG: hypothetical protein ABI895_22905 [Deltaproteobacteria bacterium]
MPSTPPPLVGFNNNVRYRGLRFHIQTEDSGVTKPHIITHLFADGGRVIKSLRTDYSEYVDHPDRPALIQRMMRDQHRAMAIDLRDGRFDATIDSLRSQPPEPSRELVDPKKTVRFPEPRAIPRAKAASSAPPAVVHAQADAEADSAPLRAAAASSSKPASSKPPKEVRHSRPPARHRPSRAPEGAKKRRSIVPKARRSLGRPSAVLEAKPSAESIFGAKPQESLDDVILSYVTQGKNTPDPRGRK